jgi:hypothetical protein
MGALLILSGFVGNYENRTCPKIFVPKHTCVRHLTQNGRVGTVLALLATKAGLVPNKSQVGESRRYEPLADVPPAKSQSRISPSGNAFQKPSSANPTQLKAKIEQAITATEAKAAIVFTDCMTKNPYEPTKFWSMTFAQSWRESATINKAAGCC